MNQPPTADSSLVVSYLVLRRAIGIIGTALPFVLVIGKRLLAGPGLPPSMSAYYYTNMRDVFVGSLCAIGVFLLSYRGYERTDDLAGDLACAFAIGVALFPTRPESSVTHRDAVVGAVHYAFAAALFFTFAFFSLHLFRKTDRPTSMTRRKRHRNLVYTVCGYTILLCIALLGVNALFLGGTAVERLDPVFWLEGLAVVSFGVSWLTKGESLLRDTPAP